RLIRSWAIQYRETGGIITSQRGRHPKIRSLLDDEDVKNQVMHYIHKHKFELDLVKFCDYIQNEIFPGLGVETHCTISNSTARRWLKQLGWQWKRYQK